MTAEQTGRYRVSAVDGWFCVECGAVVDYLDGRSIHDRWHTTISRPQAASDASRGGERGALGSASP